jgi:thymidylate synthase
MRIYKTFIEAVSEMRRDLKEMGIEVHTQTYQDKHIGLDPKMATLELQNYIFTVTYPSLADLEPVQPWADLEFEERVRPPHPRGVNPGEAYKARIDVWEQFLERDGCFGYTYSDRINNNDGASQVDQIVRAIQIDPSSRQLFMSIWEPEDLFNIGGARRVPCTLGYHFQVRRGRLNITYLQRSADMATHLQNDLYLAARMQAHVAELTGYEVGTYTHWFGSLHVFKKDVEGVF